MRHRLLDRLHALDLPQGEHALFGSGPLLVRGWIDDVGDLDVIARGPAWDIALEIGTLAHLAEHDVDVVVIDDDITIGNRWAYGDASVDDLIETAELIDDVPCVLLEHVIAYKRILRRSKDFRHLAIIESRSAHR